MKLNADVGEGVGNDEALFRWIDMANIACGGHAGSSELMASTVELAVSHGVAVGAHPGYPDKEGFGRHSMDLTEKEIEELVVDQVGALNTICLESQTKVRYVKPHGALYHDMMQEQHVYEAILKAVSSMPDGTALMIMASMNNEVNQSLANEYEVPLLFEAFADRAYTSDGSLLGRAVKGSVFSTVDQIVGQVAQLIQQGAVETFCGEILPLHADTVCIHGDNKVSIAAAEKIYQILRP